MQRETRRAKLEERLGRTYSGQPVNIDQYEALVGMKFPKFACTVALKRFNNDIDTCLRVLQDECYDELLCYSRQGWVPRHSITTTNIDLLFCSEIAFRQKIAPFVVDESAPVCSLCLSSTENEVLVEVVFGLKDMLLQTSSKNLMHAIRKFLNNFTITELTVA